MQARISLFGGLPPAEARGHLDGNLIHYKELGVFGAYGSTVLQNRLALDLLAGGAVAAEHYITHLVDLSRIVEGFGAAMDGKGLKVVVRPGPG